MNPHSSSSSSPAHAPDQQRRELLRNLFFGLGAASLPTWMAERAVAQTGSAELQLPLGPLGAQDFGPLVEKIVSDPFGGGVNHQLYAPAEFDVRVVMRHNRNPLTGGLSGTLGHVDPDGGGVFMQPDGGWIYVSNSEEGSTATPVGGVGALRFDPNGTLIDYRRICSGTRNNCAGGITPWGTWITCEEVSDGQAIECDPTGTLPQRALTALGLRPGREAVAIDPVEHAIYQTLDSGNQPFVRFVSAPEDLETLPGGGTRMRFETGVSQRLHIPAYNGLPGYTGVGIANTATENARLRQARPYQWVADTGSTATLFNGGEGIWYHEIPPALRTTPAAGTVPTARVMIFATKNDGRVWALDLDNRLIELIVDANNGQAFTNLRTSPPSLADWSQVDNVVISPMGDALVAEDGTNMRLAIAINNQPSKLLMQIVSGDSEITGPGFTADGARLYFSRQNGPHLAGTTTRGTVYELTIPPRFRAIQKADPFAFAEQRDVASGVTVTSEAVTLGGFIGPLTVSVTTANNAQFSVNGGAWSAASAPIEAGQTLRVRHTSAATGGATVDTTVTVGSGSGVNRTQAVFRSVTLAGSGGGDTTPDAFTFGERLGVPRNTVIESAAITLTGFNQAIAVQVSGATAAYRIQGGPWTSAPGTLLPGQTVQVRHTSAKKRNGVVETRLTAGGVTGTFRSRAA